MKPAYPGVVDECVPAAMHVLEQYANNPIGIDHARLKSWLRPMRSLRRFRSAQTGSRAHIRTEPAPRPIRNRHRRTRPRPPWNRLQRARIQRLTLKQRSLHTARDRPPQRVRAHVTVGDFTLRLEGLSKWLSNARNVIGRFMSASTVKAEVETAGPATVRARFAQNTKVIGSDSPSTLYGDIRTAPWSACNKKTNCAAAEVWEGQSVPDERIYRQVSDEMTSNT
jgi:hypothetical protein